MGSGVYKVLLSKDVVRVFGVWRQSTGIGLHSAVYLEKLAPTFIV